MNENNNEESKADYVDLTGVWFIYFAVDGVLEGSRILTLNGEFKKETLQDYLINHLFESLPQKVATQEYKNRLVIRAFNKIGEVQE